MSTIRIRTKLESRYTTRKCNTQHVNMNTIRIAKKTKKSNHPIYSSEFRLINRELCRRGYDKIIIICTLSIQLCTQPNKSHNAIIQIRRRRRKTEKNYVFTS